jgi:hypothetical protein
VCSSSVFECAGDDEIGNKIFEDEEDDAGEDDGDDGEALLMVDFGTPSYEFTVNICMYLIFQPMVLTPRRHQVHYSMSILEFVVYAGN